MNIVIIKYNAGNTHSVYLALQRLGVEPVITNDPDKIRRADKIIFPGVGEASAAMQSVREHGLETLLPTLKQPFLGICLGLQLLCQHSTESDTRCLGIFDEFVKKFPATGKVPHIGWNTLTHTGHPLFDGVPSDSYVYFVHSYYADWGAHTIAQTDYLLPFSAALQVNNFYAVQFHPEKSGAIGARILENFVKL